MDAKEELTFLVHMPKKIVKSRKFSNKLYSMDSNNENSFILTKKQNKILNMLEENLKCLSPRKKVGKKYQELYKAMGTPTVENLKAIIHMNIINNNVVKTENVNLFIKSYGPYVGGIKEKNTRSRSTPVVSNIVKIPDEFLEVQQDITVLINGF